MRLQLCHAGLEHFDAETAAAVADRLTEVDLSHNRLHRVVGLGRHFAHVTLLDLSSNGLTEVPPSLPSALQRLNVADNAIVSLANSLKCRQLQVLEASRNHISELPLGGLPGSLRVLGLGHNALATLGGLDGLRHLDTLRLDHNRLADRRALLPLQHLPVLRHLTLTGNPFAGGASVPPPVLLKVVPKLVTLDGRNVSQAINTASSHLHVEHPRRLQAAALSASVVAGGEETANYALSMRALQLDSTLRRERERLDGQHRKCQALVGQHRQLSGVAESQVLTLQRLATEESEMRADLAQLEETRAAMTTDFEQLHARIAADRVSDVMTGADDDVDDAKHGGDISYHHASSLPHHTRLSSAAHA